MGVIYQNDAGAARRFDRSPSVYLSKGSDGVGFALACSEHRGYIYSGNVSQERSCHFSSVFSFSILPDAVYTKPEIVGAHHHDSTLGTPQQAPSPGSSVTPPTVYPVGFSSGTPVPSRETPVPSRARVEKAPCWLPLTDRQTQETRLAKALSAVAQIVRDTRGL